jgi:hypothetical protein
MVNVISIRVSYDQAYVAPCESGFDSLTSGKSVSALPGSTRHYSAFSVGAKSVDC